MDAELLSRRRFELAKDLRTEFFLWRVPVPVRGCTHSYKYRLALIHRNVCVLRYDNEAGKGDHKHVGDHEIPYLFSTVEKLERDFRMDMASYMREKNR